MQHRWFSHLPSSEQEEFKKLVLGSQKVLDKLKQLCYNTIQNGVLPSSQDYDNPSWAYKQADRNGYLRAHQELYDLLNVTSDKDRK